jgi:hypothetical protein
MEMGHTQNTNIRLQQLEIDVIELKAQQHVESALSAPFIGEAAILSSDSFKEQTLRDAILILVANSSVDRLKNGSLTGLALLIDSAFDSLNTNSKTITAMSAGVSIDPKFKAPIDPNPSPQSIDINQHLKKVIEGEVDKQLRSFGCVGK